MTPFKTIGLSLGVVLTCTVAAHAGRQGTIKANSVVCMTQSGIEATHADLNKSQLESLGCATAPTDLRVDVLPASQSCDSYLFVAATLPEKVVRYWIKRDTLDDHAPDLADPSTDCQD
ncbi:MAG: hypothetical protein ACHQK9_13550 [Reyranellales bacterium]